jgi:hypothetical protein
MQLAHIKNRVIPRGRATKGSLATIKGWPALVAKFGQGSLVTQSHLHNTSHCILAVSISLDNTFKAAQKVTLAANQNMSHAKVWKGGIMSVINESNEIIAWVYTTRLNPRFI